MAGSQDSKAEEMYGVESFSSILKSVVRKGQVQKADNVTLASPSDQETCTTIFRMSRILLT